MPTGWPVAGFHSRTVPSASALASSLPSGLNATPYTPPFWGGGVEGRADGLAGGRVPQPHRAVGAGAGQQLAVGAERHPEHAVPGAGGVEGRADGLAGGRVPQPHRAVAVGAGQQLAVGAERHPVHAASEPVASEGRAGGLAGGRVPQPHRAVAAGAGQQLAVRAERHPVHAVWGRWPAWRGAPAGWPVAGFHSRTVPSAPALASSLPSGLNATPYTPSWRWSAWRGAPTGWPVAGFHSRTVPSTSALASSLPSGLNATPYTPPAVPAGRGGARRRGGRWPGSTAAPCRRRRRWPAACRRG